MSHQISQAGNTVVPAVLALEAAGFTVNRQGAHVIAESGVGDRYVADDPVAVLGLITLIERRTWNWQAADEEIDEVLRRLGEGH